MHQRFSRIRRALSGTLAVVMLSAYLPFSAIAPATASPIVGNKGVFADFRQTGPAGVRTAPATSATKLNVRWRPGVPKTQIAAAAVKLGFKASRTSKLGWVQLTPAARMSAGALATTLRASGLTIQARPAVTYQPAVVATNLPNDPLFPGQYGLNNTGQTGGTPDADIDAAEAWVSTTGSKNVIVAVVDEGVNIAHPDLKNNIWVNSDEIPNNGIDDDKNGYVDDIRGYDFANGDETVYDVSDGDRHGTHVAGIIGAQGNNGIGGAGVNWNVTIMPVKFLGPGGGDDFDGAEAITYAVDNGAKVINCSWGGEGESPVLEEAIAYAAKKGVLIAAAAGNWSMNVDSYKFWPASSESTNVISVAATDDKDKLAEFSNYGANTVDIAAPGVDVTSTLPAESAGIFVDYIDSKLAYKVMYLPIQVESLEPAAARDAVIERSVARLGAVSNTQILVVDDSAATLTKETQGTRLSVYLGALSSAGYTNVTSWVTDTQGTPTQAAMQGKIVVWFTGKSAYGWSGEYSVNKADQAAIASYLNGGGRLFMASGEMATDLEYFGGQYPDDYYYSEPSKAPSEPLFLQKYFHVELTDLTNWTLGFSGKEGSPFAGLSASLPGTYLSEDFLWPTGSDAILPLFDMPYLSGEGPMPGEGEMPAYDEPTVDTTTPEPAPPTRESVSTQVQVGKYGALSGTSMAAPMVSGALALLMAKYPTASSPEIAARVLNTTDQLPSLQDKTVYGGRLNVRGAMQSYPGRPTITGPSVKKTLRASSESTLTWTPAVGGDSGAMFEAEIGLPYQAWTEGFEDGTLGPFSDVGTTTPWAVSSDATDTHSGSYGAISGPVGPGIDLGDGWTEGAQSSMATTITVPPGGGTLKFWWKGTVGWDQWAEFIVDHGADYDEIWETTGWIEKTIELPAGEHNLRWTYVNFARVATTPDLHMSVDDLTLTAHAFTPLGTAPAGATALAFTVPATDTADAWFRLRARNGIDSAWAYSRGHRISTDLVAPGAPTGLSAMAMGDGVVDLGWTNPTDADFSATRVLWREGTMPTGPTDASATVSADGTATAATVTGLKNGAKLYVAAYSTDKSGNMSEATTTSVGVIDVTGPSAVKFLEARMVDGGVGVDWMSPDAASYKSITVLRRTDSTPTVGDASATVVFSGRGAVASDWTLPTNASKALYTVYAMDASGNKSAPMSVRIVPDLSAPEGELYINDGEQFTANPVVDVTSDILGASEMRLFINGEFDPEAVWVPFTATSTVDLLPLEGWQSVEGEYRDAAGNYYSTGSEIFVDRTAPSQPTSLTAENWNTGVRLNWADPNDESITAYRVWRATAATGPWTSVTPATGEECPDNSYYASGLTVGTKYYFKIAPIDGVGQVGPQSAVTSSTPDTGVVRRVGKTRYETAAIASATHIKKADTVVLVSGTADADALCAAPLAGSVNGPVLLTSRDALDGFAAAEITRLGATEVFVIGSTASVSGHVVDQLKARGLTVTRLGGANRYETAGLVALKVLELSAEGGGLSEEPTIDTSNMTLEEFLLYLEELMKGAPGAGPDSSAGWDGRLIVSNGSSAADAVAVSPFAYTSRIPILLVSATGVPSATQDALDEIKGMYGPIASGLVVGGPKAIPESVAVQVSPEWRRLGGASRYDTAVSVANYAVDQGLLDWAHVGIVNGRIFADGLAAGPAIGAIGGVIILTPTDALHDATFQALMEHSGEIGKVELFGGTNAISAGVSSQVQEAIVGSE